MSKEQLVAEYSIIDTNNGFMVRLFIDDLEDYVHAPNGDNTFDTYAKASCVLAEHLLRRVL